MFNLLDYLVSKIDRVYLSLLKKEIFRISKEKLCNRVFYNVAVYAAKLYYQK